MVALWLSPLTTGIYRQVQGRGPVAVHQGQVRADVQLLHRTVTWPGTWPARMLMSSISSWLAQPMP